MLVSRHSSRCRGKRYSSGSSSLKGKNKRGLVGNIFKARVSRVLPGMQSAFIDIGLDRTGFLHISDIIDNEAETQDSDKVVTTLQNTSIRAVLQEGQIHHGAGNKRSLGN